VEISPPSGDSLTIREIKSSEIRLKKADLKERTQEGINNWILSKMNPNKTIEISFEFIASGKKIILVPQPEMTLIEKKPFL